MFTKRALLAGMAATGFGLAAARPASAQTYPTRPVKMVVPLPPGSAPDVRHRLIAQALTQLWGQQVIVEAWDRSTAPGATSRSTISSASVRLQRLRLACRSGARLIPILATRHGRARPGHACLWTDILNPL